MAEMITGYHPVLLALFGTLFTWGMTAAGSGLVFFFKTANRKFLELMLGFAGGVMIAASYWSLLAPAIEMSEGKALPSFVPPLIGFLLGAFFLYAVDKILPHMHRWANRDEAEGIETNWHSSILLVLAITLHNIPEGLAVGVAFGALGAGFEGATLGGAVALALGIGIQNFPEGTAVSLPLRGTGMSRLKSFWYGQLSGAVEPVAAVIGAMAVILMQPLLPYALAFAAGAMIYVVIEEVIPESQKSGDTDLPTIATLIGFSVMMTLDVALG